MMNTHESTLFTDGFCIGHIVWARRDYDGLYWPARVTSITNNSMSQPCSYLIHSFETNHTHWTVDVLPYRPYRDYMSKHLVIHYQSDAQTISQLSHAVDLADGHDHSSRSSLPVGSTTFGSAEQNLQPITTEHRYSTNDYSTATGYYPSAWNCLYGTSSASYPYCSCCPQPSHSTPTSNGSHSTLDNKTKGSQTLHSNAAATLIIVTRRAYLYPSFLTHLLQSLDQFTHRSIFYIDDHPNNTPPLPTTTNNITYLICLDQFHPPIQQMLDATVLNNLNAHINYCFLLLNAPSQRLISHVYETVMDKRQVLVLHYHSTVDDAPLLLCSGARETFEMVRGSVLQCLCAKVKYVDAAAAANNDEQRCSSNVQPVCSATTDMTYPPNGTANLGWLLNSQNTSSGGWSTTLSSNKPPEAVYEGKKPDIKIFKVKHQRTSSETVPECNVKNILSSVKVSK